jgi:hypothetical protein
MDARTNDLIDKSMPIGAMRSEAPVPIPKTANAAPGKTPSGMGYQPKQWSRLSRTSTTAGDSRLPSSLTMTPAPRSSVSSYFGWRPCCGDCGALLPLRSNCSRSRRRFCVIADTAGYKADRKIYPVHLRQPDSFHSKATRTRKVVATVTRAMPNPISATSLPFGQICRESFPRIGALFPAAHQSRQCLRAARTV